MLKSWKGDYLHRPDTPQGVTTWNTGVGNEWILLLAADKKIMLKSWKGDYLHRPDTPQGVTTWNTGIGNEWDVEVITPIVARETIEQYLSSSDKKNMLKITLDSFEDAHLTQFDVNKLKGIQEDRLRGIQEDPMGEFLKYAPENYRESFSEDFLSRANEILKHLVNNKLSMLRSNTSLGASWWKCTICQVGMWASLVIILGAAIAISQGALVAPILALDVGLGVVLAAITGLSEGAILALAGGAGLTFGILISELCKALNACS